MPSNYNILSGKAIFSLPLETKYFPQLVSVRAVGLSLASSSLSPAAMGLESTELMSQNTPELALSGSCLLLTRRGRTMPVASTEMLEARMFSWSQEARGLKEF